MLSKGFNKTFGLVRAARSFGSGPNTFYKVDNDLAPTIEHPSGREEEHHAHTATAALDHKFIAPKTGMPLVMSGMHGTAPLVVSVDN